MLSVFPEILFLSPFAPLLIRVALAALFANAAWQHVRGGDTASRALGVTEGTVAILLLAGAWTQPAALVGAAIAAVWYFRPSARPIPVSTTMLAAVMSISLLVTGAGAFAFDLPF